MPAPIDRGARYLAVATLSYMSVIAGALLYSGFIDSGRSWVDETIIHVGCGFSTLTLTVLVVQRGLAQGSSTTRLFFETLSAACANTAICSLLAFQRAELTLYAMSIGAVVWGPVGVAYFLVIALTRRVHRTIEATPSHDLWQRRATLSAVLLATMASVACAVDVGSPRIALFTIAMGAPALVLTLVIVAFDARDRLFLRAVARERHTRLSLRPAMQEDDASALRPFVAGLERPAARYVIYEKDRAGGPFRDVARPRPLFSVAERARPLLRRVALCLVLALVTGAMTASGAASLVMPYRMATLSGR
jgi:hypothetical protein